MTGDGQIEFQLDQILLFMSALDASPEEASDQGNYEQNDRDPKQDFGTRHSGSRNAAKTQNARHQGNNQKYHGPIKQIAHDILLGLSLPSTHNDPIRNKFPLRT